MPPPPVGIHTKIKYEDEPNWVGMGGAEAVAGGAGAGRERTASRGGGAGAGRERTATKGGADTPKSATGGGGGEGADGFSLAGTSVANTSMVVPNLRSVPTTPSVSCDLIFHNNSEVRVKCFWVSRGSMAPPFYSFLFTCSPVIDLLLSKEVRSRHQPRTTGLPAPSVTSPTTTIVVYAGGHPGQGGRILLPGAQPYSPDAERGGPLLGRSVGAHR